jgi:hypothetical protein
MQVLLSAGAAGLRWRLPAAVMAVAGSPGDVARKMKKMI